MEAVVGAILEEHDRDGRVLCPPFRVLVSPQEFPMYYQVIKDPIDLQKIARKIRDGDYTSWTEFGNDLKLMYANAKQFNQPSSSIAKDAAHLNTLTKQKLQQFQTCKKISQAE
jgi:protein polybromo-1